MLQSALALLSVEVSLMPGYWSICWVFFFFSSRTSDLQRLVRNLIEIYYIHLVVIFTKVVNMARDQY